MKRGIVSVIATAAMAGASLLAQDAWQHWQYVAPVELGASEPPRLVSAAIPSTVTGLAAPGWRDLRLIDDQGQEVPFVLHARAGSETHEWRTARLLDPGFVAGQYTQTTIDLGPSPDVHNALFLTLGGSDDVQTWAEIAVSQDGQSWQVVESHAPVFRLTQSDRGERTDVSYPDSRSRFLRLRLFEPSKALAITSVRVAHEVEVAAERVRSAIQLFPQPSNPPDGRTTWTSADGGAPEPLSEIRFSTDAPQFIRRVTIESADAEGPWREVARGDIHRIPPARAEDSRRERLSVSFPEAVAARWRVSIVNRNDAPLAAVTAVALTTPRHIVFTQQVGRAYRVVFGNPRAVAPMYDLAELTEASAIDTTTLASLGGVVANAGFVDPAPWTERHAYLLWGLVALAILILGLVAVRALRSSTTNPVS